MLMVHDGEHNNYLQEQYLQIAIPKNIVPASFGIAGYAQI